MKARFFVISLAILMATSISAQDYTYKVISREGSRYEGEWPTGYGVLYSYEDGLVLGDFRKGKPHGKCVCYKPNGEVYWGDFKKGKATGNGRIYRDNGIVVAGQYKNGRYHGLDTLYRSNGSMHVGKYRNGKLKSKVYDSGQSSGAVKGKPEYPRVDLRYRQEDFLKELEILWEERNIRLRQSAGLVNPRFQGGDIDDFALWVNTQVAFPMTGYANRTSRTVIVEFMVLKDGTVADAHAVFGTDPVLNEEAVKAVSKSPKWEPAELGGEKKDVRLRVPVVFSNE